MYVCSIFEDDEIEKNHFYVVAIVMYGEYFLVVEIARHDWIL